MGLILLFLWRLALGFIAFVVLMFELGEACSANASAWVVVPLLIATPVVPLWIVLSLFIPDRDERRD